MMIIAEKFRAIILIVLGLIAFGILWVVLTKSAHAQSVPTIISHQGRLLNSSNQPVTSNVSVDFAIFDAASGGTQAWTETQSITPDNLGFYETFLGGVTALPATLPNPSYLQITVQSETLNPRLQFGSVPFAQRSGTAQSADSANLANDLNCSGCVGTTDIADTSVTSRKLRPILETKEFTFTFPSCGGGLVPITQSDINITTDVSSKILAFISIRLFNPGAFTSPQVEIEIDGTSKQPQAWTDAGTFAGAARIATLNTHAVASVGTGSHTVRIIACSGSIESSVVAYNARLTVQAFAQ